MSDLISSKSVGISPFSFGQGKSSDADIDSISKLIVPQDRGVIASIMGSVALSPIAIADITSASFGLTERGEVEDSVLAGLPGGVEDFYRDNTGVIQGVATVGEVVLSAFVGGAVTKSGTKINSAIKALPGGKLVANIELQYKKALAKVRLADRNIAGSKGVIGPEAKYADAFLKTSGVVNRKTLAVRARKLGAARGAIQGVFAEMTLGAIASENDFLYTDETGTNVAWAALGIALPAGFDFIATNAAMSKFLASDKVNRIAAKVTDRGGFDVKLDEAIGWLDEGSETITTKGTTGQILSGNGAKTDEITASLLARQAKSVRELNPDGTVNITLEQSRNKAALQNEKRAFDQLQEIAGKGIPSVDGTSIKFTQDVAVANHMKALGHSDPTYAFGAEFFGKLSSESGDLFTGAAKTAKIFKDEMIVQQNRANVALTEIKLTAKPNPAEVRSLEKLIKQTEFFRDLEPMVARNMELVGLDDLKELTKEFTGKVIRERTPEGFTVHTAEDLSLGVSSKGTILLPKKLKLNSLSQEESQGLFAAGDDFIKTAATTDNFVLDVSAKANWFELDMAEMIMQASPTATVRFPNGITREAAQMESLAQKVEVIKGLGEKANPLLTRERLNLPKLSAYERGISGTDRTALDVYIKGIQNGNAVRTQSSKDLRSALLSLRKATDIVEYAPEEITLLGNSFQLGRDLKGNPIESFLTFKRPLRNAGFFSRDFLDTRLADNQADIFASLTKNPNSSVGKVTTDIVGTSAYKESIRTSTLADAQLGTNIPGLSDITPPTAIAAVDWVARNNPAILAAQTINDFFQRAVRADFTNLVKAPVKRLGGKSPSDIWSVLRKPQNSGSKQLLNQFISARRGWELTDDVARLNGDVTFPLKSRSQHNKQLWKRLFGEDMPEGAKLPLQNGQPAILDDMGFEGLQAMQVVAVAARRENNILLASKGFGELKRQPFYVPPPTYDGKFVNFVMDANGQVLSTLSAPTESGLKSLVNQLQKQPNSILNQQGVHLRTQAAVEEFQTIWDRAKRGLDDANVAVFQSGKTRSGSALNTFTDFNAMDEAVNQLATQYNRLSRDTIEVLYTNQINAAKSRAATVRVNKINRATGTASEVRNIHDIYLNALLGRNPLNTNQSSIGSVYGAIENAVDGVLRVSADNLNKVNPFSGSVKAAREYVQLEKQLGDKMPFTDVTDFVAQKTATQTPPTVKKFSNGVNRLAAGLILRWGEIAHPILNITGAVNTIPSVIQHYTMRPGESLTAFKNRVGPTGNIFELKGGRAVGALDMGKIMRRAFANAWDRKNIEGYDFRVQHGYLTQEVAEFNKSMAAIHSAAGLDQFLRKADKFAGFLSDRSEDFSRSMAHFAGLEVADIMGITGRTNRELFAHQMANRAIANYNPVNRPEIFQGGVGGPLGLFQSYMWNYWQRMFRYVETRDSRALATSMAMQGSLFGLATVPGFRQFNDIINSVNDGETNPYDGIYNNFGRDVGDLLTSGVVSSIPKMFGADDGIALYTRGDISPRVPIVNGIPITQIASNLFGGIGQGIQAMMDDVPGISEQQVVEIASNMFTNRPISGLFDIMAGVEVDKQGNVVSDQVQTSMGMLARVVGMKTLSEQKSIEAFYSNKTQASIQLAKRQTLNRAARAAIRGKRFDSLPDIFVGYLNSGGDVRYIKTYLSELIKSAGITRSDRQLLKVIGNPNKMSQLMRAINARQ